ncbi:MAG TPA: cadherin-like domain-containing protein, partial [Acidimicrobiales bacterium]|nr:cadherin-like domain-containing protein [Acidimicrobiales bacterium]
MGAVTLASGPTREFGESFTATSAPPLEEKLSSAVIDPGDNYAYFGTRTRPGVVVKVDLRRFERVHAITPPGSEFQLDSAVIDPAGAYAYFGTTNQLPRDSLTGEQPPDKVVKVQLKRPPSPALSADADTYATDYETPLSVPAPGVLDGDADSDNDPIVAVQPSDPAGGSVVLNADGSFTYTPDARFAGTDTFTYTASDGMGYSAPATVSIEVAPPVGLQAISYNYYTNVSLFGG